MAAINVCQDLNIFQLLVDAGEQGLSLQSLVASTHAQEALLARLMAMLIACGCCTRDAAHIYHGTADTSIWADVALTRDSVLVAAQLPVYLRQLGYREPLDTDTSAFTHTHGQPFWQRMRSHGDDLLKYNRIMASGVGRTSVLPLLYPVRERLLAAMPIEASDDASIVVVDLGGNRGGEIRKLRDRYPELRGRLVLQDLPDVVAACDVESLEGVQIMAHDFFQAQPVRGARAYHFRSVLHDWSDEACRRILAEIVKVMTPGYSKLLISDNVLIEGRTSPEVCASDMAMLAFVCARERTKMQWEELLASCGLSIVYIVQAEEGGQSTMEAVLAE